MKYFLSALATLLGAVAAPAFAADVGVSVQIGEPGFYGRIDIGNFPQPQLIYPQPMIVQPVPPGVVRAPLYLRVPPGHAKNWRKYCGRYNACGQPVYFVQDRWYNDVYAPRMRERHGEGRGERRSEERGDGRGHGPGKGRGHKGD